MSWPVACGQAHLACPDRPSGCRPQLWHGLSCLTQECKAVGGLCFHFVHETKRTCRAGPRAPFTQGQRSSEREAVLIVSAHVSSFLVTTPTEWKKTILFHLPPRGELSLQPFMFPYKERHEFLHSLLLDSELSWVTLTSCSLDQLERLLGLTQWTAAVLSRVREAHLNVPGVPRKSQEDHRSRWLFLSTRGLKGQRVPATRRGHLMLLQTLAPWAFTAGPAPVSVKHAVLSLECVCSAKESRTLSTFTSLGPCRVNQRLIMVLKEFSVNFLADVLVLSNGSEGYKDNCLGGVGFHF